MAKRCCDFCGRSEDDVKLLINGLHGFICEDCAQQAYEIVMNAGLVNKSASASAKAENKKSVWIIVGTG